MKISSRLKMKIIRRILKGESYSSIARDYNVSSSFICLMGREMGLMKNPKIPLKWTPEAIDSFLVSRGSTIRRVSTDIINCHVPMTWKCNLCGHQWSSNFDGIRSRKELKGCQECGRNPYTVFHDFLETLNPLSVYFIGVYMAVGKVKANTISIHSRDKGKLEKIASLISCTYPIKTYTRSGALSPTYYLEFHSSKIAKQLASYKKYFNDKNIPKNLMGKDFITHFLRGYIDFHAYVEYFKCKGYNDKIFDNLRLTICGSLNFLTQLQSLYKKYGALDDKKRAGYIRKNKGEFYITGGDSTFYFMRWIYNSEVNPLRYVSNSMYDSYMRVKERYCQERDKKLYIIGKREEYHKLSQEFHKYSTFSLIGSQNNVSMRQVAAIAKGRIPSLPVELVNKISIAINKRKQLKKQMKEIKTRVFNKAGIKRIEGLIPSRFQKVPYIE